MSPFLGQLTLFSGGIALAVALGGLFPLRLDWVKAHLPAFLSFSAGVMLGAAFLHLLPEASGLAPINVGVSIIVGFLLLYVFERFVTVHICEVLECQVHSIGIAAFVGLAIHAFTEGIALGTGLLMADKEIGWIVFISIILHKALAALALTSILLHENYRRSTIALLQGLFFLMVPLGAMAVYGFFLWKGNAIHLGMALGFSIGTFLHISLSDLLPEVHRSRYRNSFAFAALVLGLFVMAFFKFGDLH